MCSLRMEKGLFLLMVVLLMMASTWAALAAQREPAKWHCRTTVSQYRHDINAYRAKYGKTAGEARFFAECKPVRTVKRDGNLLLQEGVTSIWSLLIGGTETAFDNANARIGVGDSTTAAADSDTGLQAATNVAYAVMDTGYPQLGAAADKKVIFRGTFGAAAANFAWAEWTVDNGAAAAKNLNRKVESLGTKSGGTWMITVEISLS